MSSQAMHRALESDRLSAEQVKIVLLVVLFFACFCLLALGTWLTVVSNNGSYAWLSRMYNLSNSLNDNYDGEIETKFKFVWLPEEERAKILKAFFEKRIFLFRNNASGSHQGFGETDAEKGEVAVALKADENVQPLTVATSMIGGEENSPLESREHECEIQVLPDNQEKEATSEEEEEEIDDRTEGDDMDHERTCCVCMNAYKEEDPLITGSQCNHVFHYACCMAWLNKNVQCPYCRRPMITEEELIQAAGDVRRRKEANNLNDIIPPASFANPGFITSTSNSNDPHIRQQGTGN